MGHGLLKRSGGLTNGEPLDSIITIAVGAGLVFSLALLPALLIGAFFGEAKISDYLILIEISKEFLIKNKR